MLKTDLSNFDSLESHSSSRILEFEIGHIYPWFEWLQILDCDFSKDNMIRKTSLLRHESPCLPLKIFKLLNKREEQSNNAEKTVVIFLIFLVKRDAAVS